MSNPADRQLDEMRMLAVLLNTHVRARQGNDTATAEQTADKIRVMLAEVQRIIDE